MCLASAYLLGNVASLSRGRLRGVSSGRNSGGPVIFNLRAAKARARETVRTVTLLLCQTALFFVFFFLVGYVNFVHGGVGVSDHSERLLT